MQIEVKNLCKIKEAYINLNGLTIISGENDTGKSTIGKILFSIINSSKIDDMDLEEILDHVLMEVEFIYFYLRRNILPTRKDFEEMKKIFFPPTTMAKIEHLCRDGEFRKIEVLLEDKFRQIISLNNDKLDITKIKRNINNIIRIIENINNEDLRRNEKIKRYLFSEFNFEINNKFLDNYSNVKLYDGSNELVDLIVKDDNLSRFKINDILNFKNATYIDTPLILQMRDLIMYAKQISINKKQIIPIHMIDLIEKIESSQLFYEKNNFAEDINTIINGSFKINEQNKDFSFHRKHEMKNFEIKPLNTASGIKSFGVLELLINSKKINSTNILIIDEPEIHLHPEWQIKYAEIICKLVKKGINILITTHSPYMLQALDYFSEDLKNDEKFTSYITNDKNGITYFEDVTYDINKAFIKLSMPLQKIMWKE